MKLRFFKKEKCYYLAPNYGNNNHIYKTVENLGYIFAEDLTSGRYLIEDAITEEVVKIKPEKVRKINV